MTKENKRSDYLIKIAEKKEYLEDIMRGLIYMKESKYFRYLENEYRGDKADGLFPIDVEASKLSIVGIDIPPTSCNLGFEGDDKVPMFCATYFNLDILDRIDGEKYRLKREVAEELKLFGKYALVIHLGEFIYRIKEYASMNDMLYRFGKINYTDEKYIMGRVQYANQIDAFFKKSLAYRNQNEWRLLLLKRDGSPVIKPDDDHFIAKIKRLEGVTLFEIDDVLYGEITVKD